MAVTRYAGPVAAAALVGAVLAVALVAVLGRSEAPTVPRDPAPTPTSPSATAAGGSVPPPAGPEPFSCPRGRDADTPPVDLVEQAGVVERTGGLVTEAYRVHRAAATPLGPVALVEGDLAAARAGLAARGVAIVEAWDPTDESRLPFLQVDRVVDRTLDSAIRRVSRVLASFSSVRWLAVTRCADRSGIVVEGDGVRGRRAELQALLARTAGAPVYVVPAGRARR